MSISVLAHLDIVQQTAQQRFQEGTLLLGKPIEKLSDDRSEGRDKVRDQGPTGLGGLDDDSPAVGHAHPPDDETFGLEPVEEPGDPGVVGPQPGRKLARRLIGYHAGAQEQCRLLAGDIEGRHAPIDCRAKIPGHLEDERRNAPIELILVMIQQCW